MSNAVKCDCCGALVEEERAINLGEVYAPDGANWSDVDVCADCFGRPFGEVIAAACIDFRDHAPRPVGEEEEAPAAPPEPTFTDQPTSTSLGTEERGDG